MNYMVLYEYILLIKITWYDESEFPLTTFPKPNLFPEITVITSALRIHPRTLVTYLRTCICMCEVMGHCFVWTYVWYVCLLYQKEDQTTGFVQSVAIFNPQYFLEIFYIDCSC